MSQIRHFPVSAILAHKRLWMSWRRRVDMVSTAWRRSLGRRQRVGNWKPEPLAQRVRQAWPPSKCGAEWVDGRSDSTPVKLAWSLRLHREDKNTQHPAGNTYLCWIAGRQFFLSPPAADAAQVSSAPYAVWRGVRAKPAVGTY